jgi:nucleolar pre-ribosomal-associated protein 2
MLVSASEKWKKVAGWHMQFVLMEYVTLQLEMRMESSLREKLVPGIYAVFDTTSIESRRAIGSRLDSSQRAVFGGLVRDYLRFGKWKGL